MTRHGLSCVLVPLLSAALVAQPAVQVAAPESQAPPPQAPAAVTATAPAEQPAASILQDGTPMKLRLLNKLDSKTAKNGDQIPFDVVNDVVVGGVTVLRRGSSATGVVTQAEGSKTMGRAGRLSFIINAIQLSDGGKVPVRAFSRTSGENRTGEMIADMIDMAAFGSIAAVPFFLLIHGTNTVFPKGTEITAFVNGDLRLDLGSFVGPPSAETAEKEFETVLQINSTPNDTQVQIDGAAAGSTPLKVKLPAGKHEISIKKAGYSDWSKTLDLSGGTANVEAVLIASPAQ